MRWFDPAGWVSLVEEHRVQVSAVVPSMIQMLLAQPLEEARVFAGLFLPNEEVRRREAGDLRKMGFQPWR